MLLDRAYDKPEGIPMADVFSTVPEFLAAFSYIRQNGFFDWIELKINACEGTVYSCTLHISGYVAKETKYQKKGSGTIVDPNTLIDSCRTLAGSLKVKNVSTKIETKDWPLWDKNCTRVIGSQGQHTELMIRIDF